MITYLFVYSDVCSHPKDTGNCQTAIVKWYYDHETRRCQQFHYGGCGGSGNRFSFLEECESICVKLIEPPAPSTHNDTSESHAGNDTSFLIFQFKN